MKHLALILNQTLAFLPGQPESFVRQIGLPTCKRMKWAGDCQKERMERPGRCRRRFRRLNHSGESGSHIMTLSSGSLAIAQRSNERNVIRACASRENQAGFISFQVFTLVRLKLNPTRDTF